MTQIEERILSGDLRPSDRLPSERELASLLGVSRPSLRESLRVLEALDIVEIRPGGGSEGGATLVGKPGAAFVNLLRLQLALGQFTHRDILETRIALETWSCREAAVQATPEDCSELSAILDTMDDTSLSTSDFNRLDARFHVRIAESIDNALTTHLMTSLRAAIEQQMIEAYSRLDDWRAVAAIVQQEHRAILQAIEDHEPDRAADLVQHHIRSFYQGVRLN